MYFRSVLQIVGHVFGRFYVPIDQTSRDSGSQGSKESKPKAQSPKLIAQSQRPTARSQSHKVLKPQSPKDTKSDRLKGPNNHSPKDP